SSNFTALTVLAFMQTPHLWQQSSAHCAYSCQLHSPALAKCRMPPSTLPLKKRGGISAISNVYVGVENLSATASIYSSSRARLIIASMKLGRSGPNTQETRTTRDRSCTARTFSSPARLDSP